MREWTPRIAEVSRRLRSRADAILGAVWFMPQDGLPALPARVACLGRVPGGVAAALFAPQHPERVAVAVDDAWRDHDPDPLVAPRLPRADQVSRGCAGGRAGGVGEGSRDPVAGGRGGSLGGSRCLRRAACAAATRDTTGRPLARLRHDPRAPRWLAPQRVDGGRS